MRRGLCFKINFGEAAIRARCALKTKWAEAEIWPRTWSAAAVAAFRTQRRWRHTHGNLAAAGNMRAGAQALGGVEGKRRAYWRKQWRSRGGAGMVAFASIATMMRSPAADGADHEDAAEKHS